MNKLIITDWNKSIAFMEPAVSHLQIRAELFEESSIVSRNQSIFTFSLSGNTHVIVQYKNSEEFAWRF